MVIDGVNHVVDSPDSESVFSPVGPRLHPVAAVAIGFWYSIVLGSAITLGIKSLDRSHPTAHGALQTLGWALGVGVATFLATLLSRSDKIVVGFCSSGCSALLWLAVLYFLRGERDQTVDQRFFGHSIAIGHYLIGFTILVFVTGFLSTLLALKAPDLDSVGRHLLAIRSVHWVWLWLPALAWGSVWPIGLYFIWIQFGVGLYSIFHPSLWFALGTGLFFGSLGIAALLVGMSISLTAVADATSYGAIVWKRSLVFIFGTIVLVSVASPLLLNLDIDRLKAMIVALDVHPWWMI